jgi:hypothetical protein
MLEAGSAFATADGPPHNLPAFDTFNRLGGAVILTSDCWLLLRLRFAHTHHIREHVTCQRAFPGVRSEESGFAPDTIGFPKPPAHHSLSTHHTALHSDS